MKDSFEYAYRCKINLYISVTMRETNIIYTNTLAKKQ